MERPSPFDDSLPVGRGDNFWNFQSRVTMENTGLSVLKYGKYSKDYGDTLWRLWIYNDHSHLG